MRTAPRLHPLPWTLALVAIAAALMAFTQPGGTPQPPRVAIVDVFRVLNGLQETKDLKKKLDSRGEELVKSLKERETNLKAKRDDFRQLKADDPTRRDKYFEVLKLEQSLDADRAIAERLLNFEGGDMRAGQWQKIVAAVGRIAARDKYDLITQDDRSQELPAQGTDDEMRSAMLVRKRILYAAPQGIDITDQVISMLNNDYNAGK